MSGIGRKMDGPIFSGGPFTETLPDESFGQFLIKYILKKDPEAVGHINASTGETLTNSQFLELAYKIAAGLKNLGVGAADIVVLSGENSFRNAAAALACILLNATFAPMDPHLKPFELSNVLVNYMPHYVLCNANQAESFHKVLTDLDVTSNIILLDQNESGDSRYIGFSYILEQSAAAVEPTSVGSPEEDLAVIMPSSGSTGLPKGVCISHRSLVFMGSFMAKSPHLSGLFLQTSHLFWISGLYSLIGSFLGQSRVFLPRLETSEILNAIKKHKVEMVFLSPSELTSLLKRPDLNPEDLASLKLIGSGGGSLTQFIVDNLRQKIPSKPMVVHAYGLTENVAPVTRYVPGMDPLSVGKVEVGNEIKVVNPETGEIKKQGEIGEIRIRSHYHFRGYIGNPDAYKQAFDEYGWLRTGDLGYFDSEGFKYITGRIKSLIKFRSMQISPEEVESLLTKMEGVLDVAVDGYPNKEDGYHALALVVKTPGSSLTEEQVQDYVKDNMSAHNCLRGGVYFVDAIPRTTHKKVSRSGVRELSYKVYRERYSL